MTLLELEPGEEGTISALLGGGPIRRRLLDLGLLPSATVTLTRTAPGSGPIWVSLGTLELALRRSEAALVRLAPLDRRSTDG